jgi:hypothetical protein
MLGPRMPRTLVRVWLLWLAAACTPVGEVNRSGQQQRATTAATSSSAGDGGDSDVDAGVAAGR